MSPLDTYTRPDVRLDPGLGVNKSPLWPYRISLKAPKKLVSELVTNLSCYHLKGSRFWAKDDIQTEQMDTTFDETGRGSCWKLWTVWQGWTSSHQLQEMQPGGGRWQWGWRSRWGRRGGRSGWPPSRAQAGPEEADVMASKQQGAAQ